MMHNMSSNKPCFARTRPPGRAGDDVADAIIIWIRTRTRAHIDCLIGSHQHEIMTALIFADSCSAN
jgi:hypothetical protein